MEVSIADHFKCLYITEYINLTAQYALLIYGIICTIWVFYSTCLSRRKPRNVTFVSSLFFFLYWYRIWNQSSWRQEGL